MFIKSHVAAATFDGLRPHHTSTVETSVLEKYSCLAKGGKKPFAVLAPKG